MTTEDSQAPAPAPAAPAPAPAAPAPAPAPLSLESGAPAPAPAATTVPPAPTPAAPAPAPTAVQYNPTGDAGLDMVLGFVGENGYAPDHPAMKAAMEGDFTLLEADLASKGVKGAEAYMKLGREAFTRTRAATEAKQKADREGVENAVGGPDEWRNVQSWASKEASPEEKAEISKQLASGGLAAQMAAVWLKGLYDKANAPAVTDGPGKAVAQAKGAATSNAALSPSEYAAEVAKARIAHKGHGFEESPAYRALRDRRMAFRG